MEIDAFLAGLKQRSGLDNLASLEDMVGQATRQGVLSPLPQRKNQEVTDAFIATRLSTVRSRLTWLGYLPAKIPGPPAGQPRLAIDDQARQAIKDFQGDAGLRVDGWVGPESWTALEELVSFEHPTDVPKWLAKNRRNRRAFWRAVGLRLSVLGLSAKPTPEEDELKPVLASFARLAGLLRLADAPLSENDLPQTLDLLFNQDALVERLGRTEGAYPYDAPPGTSDLARRFVTCVARIELWLLGGKVDLKANSDPRNSLKDLQPTAALFDFWRMQALDVTSARQRSNQALDGSFFRALHAATTDSFDLQDQTEFTDWLFKRLSRKDSALRQPLWDTIQNLGSLMWDGLRRVWSWVMNGFQSAGKMLPSWVLNLARLTYQLALNAFEATRKAFDRLGKAVRFGLPGVLPGSQLPDFFIRATPTLDYTVFVSQPEQAPQLRDLASEALQHALDFDTATTILAALLKALAASFNAILLPGAGWFIFIVALTKAVVQITRAARAF